MTDAPHNQDTDGRTDEDTDPTFPFEKAATWNYNTCGIGEVTGDLDEYADYEHAKVDTDLLQELLDVADTFGWDHVHLALCDERPLVVQNADEDDKPTLVLAPRIGEGFGDD